MFRQIAVVGFGLIGGSLAQAVRERWPDAHVVAIDQAAVVDTALRLGAANAGSDDLAAAAGAELIVLAAPVRQNINLLRDLPERVPGQALVTDVGSTKQATLEAATQLPSRLRFIGGHPLAGAAASGIAAARKDLFKGRHWILTPPDNFDGTDLEQLLAFVHAVGAIPKTMDPIAHDRLMAYLSHLPQLTVSALMKVVGERAGEEGLEFAGGGLRDTTRLASSPGNTWRDVTATNVEPVSQAIDELVVALQRLKADLVIGNELQRVFDSAGMWKRVLDDPATAPRDES
jgi:prephenate dehydrogenase